MPRIRGSGMVGSSGWIEVHSVVLTSICEDYSYALGGRGDFT